MLSLNELNKQYEEYKAKGLKLDMSRGKPAPAQLELSMNIVDVLNEPADFVASNGMDVRNYGGLDGIPEAKALLAPIAGVPTSNIIIGGNSSLNMMYDTIARAMTHGIGQSTLTSSKIATDADLATESDSEFIGTWQQKPIKKFLKRY